MMKTRAGEIIEKIELAKTEVLRFLKTANKWEKALKDDRGSVAYGSKEGGTCKRSSLDLANALVELRKPLHW